MPWSPDTARAYAGLGPQHHIEILRSVVPELLGDLSGRRVLDFGCGPGRLAVLLAEQGAARVVGVDESPKMVEQARAAVAALGPELRDRLAVHRGTEADIEALGTFDAILSSLALMMCPTRDRLHSVVRSLVAALSETGRLVVVVTHPCFRRRDYGTFRYELPDDFDYWRSGAPYDVHLTPESTDESAVITDYHWTLGDYCRAVTESGAVLTGLVELPADRDEDGRPSGPPAYLSLCAERR